MIPRVRLDRVHREQRSAFDCGARGRPLRVLVDRTTVSGADAELLLELCRDEEVDGLSTSGDDGLPQLVIGEVGSDDVAPLPTEGAFEGFVWPVSQIRRRAAAVSEETGEREADVFASLMLSSAAHARRVDALVTSAPTLLRGTTPREGNAVTLGEALALLGLYLRSRDRFTLGRIEEEQQFFGHPVTLSWWMTYLVLTREHLPSMWRWFSACVDSKGDEDMSALGHSVFRRVDRSLRVRDRLHIECQREPTDRTNDEALFQLDVLLFTLYGAFDGAARVAHHVYALPRSARNAGWVRRNWLRLLGDGEPALAALVQADTAGYRLLRLMSVLRNTIHGAPLHPIGSSGYDRRNLVEIPASDREEVAELADHLGGRAAWGLRVTKPYVYVEPDVFCERLMPPALELLDRILATTAVDRLPGVEARTLLTGPPDEFPFTTEIRRRLRLLGGVGN
jgi:hypothetical protein